MVEKDQYNNYKDGSENTKIYLIAVLTKSGEIVNYLIPYVTLEEIISMPDTKKVLSVKQEM